MKRTMGGPSGPLALETVAHAPPLWLFRLRPEPPPDEAPDGQVNFGNGCDEESKPLAQYKVCYSLRGKVRYLNSKKKPSLRLTP